MNTMQKEMTAPMPSAATEAGQPFDMNSEVSIAQSQPDGKKNFSEIMREYNAFTRQHDPNRIHAVTITELMEEEHETRRCISFPPSNTRGECSDSG